MSQESLPSLDVLADEASFCPGCSGCAAPVAREEVSSAIQPLSGGRLVVTSMAVFLLPLVLAIVSATFLAESQDARFLAALAGFAVGVGVAMGLGRVFCRVREASQ